MMNLRTYNPFHAYHPDAVFDCYHCEKEYKWADRCEGCCSVECHYKLKAGRKYVAERLAQEMDDDNDF